MNLIAYDKEQLATMLEDVLDGMRTGLQNWQAGSGLPAGLAIDPQTGHAYVDVTVKFVPSLNAYTEQTTQGAQTDSSSTQHGESTTTSEESGGDSSDTRYYYGEI